MSYHIIELYVMTITAFLATTFIDCYGILNVLANLTFRGALLLQPITPCTKYTTVAKWIERIISYSTTSLYVYVTKMLNEFKDRNFTCIYGICLLLTTSGVAIPGLTWALAWVSTYLALTSKADKNHVIIY